MGGFVDERREQANEFGLVGVDLLSGAVGLAESAQTYLADLPATYRGVDLTTVRQYLFALEVDPERIERAAPPRLNYHGTPLMAADLSVEEIVIAAETIAEDSESYDEQIIETRPTTSPARRSNTNNWLSRWSSHE